MKPLPRAHRIEDDLAVLANMLNGEIFPGMDPCERMRLACQQVRLIRKRLDADVYGPARSPFPCELALCWRPEPSPN